MSSRQRAIVFGLGAMAVALVVAVVLIVVSGGGPTKLAVSSGTPAPTSTAPLAPSTVELLPVLPSTTSTSVVPTTTTSTTLVATTTTLPPPVNGSGAVLKAPTASDVRSGGSGCQSLADSGWGNVQCGSAQARGATLTWLVESTGAGNALRTNAYVFEAVPQGEQVVLEEQPGGATKFVSAQARVDAIEGSGFQDIVFGFRDSAQNLAVDLVQGPGLVAVHWELTQGVARTQPGQLDVWTAVPAASGQGCCPAYDEHYTIKYLDGAWRVVSAESVPPSVVPPSEL